MRTSGSRAAGLALAATAVVGVVGAVGGAAQADDDTGVSAQVLLPTTTTLETPAVARYGTDVTLRGKVATLTSGLGLGATDVRLTFDPVKGATRTLTVHTDGSGNFVAHVTPKVRTVVHAVSAAGLLYDGSEARTVMKVEAPVRCAIGAVRSAGGGSAVPGSCVVKGLAAGTKYLVQTRGGGSWHNAITARTEKNKLSFVLPLRSGTTAFRVFVLPGRKWVPTASDTFKVTV